MLSPEVLAEAEERLAELDERIAAGERLLAQLKQTRRDLAGAVAKHHAEKRAQRVPGASLN